MRIISSFKDYYDSVQIYGQSDSVYIRNPEEIDCDISWGKFYPYNYEGLLEIDERLIPHAIGFCGKIYYCIQYNKINHGENKNISHCFYDFDSLNEFILTNFNKKQIKTYLNQKVYIFSTYQNNLKKFFKENKYADESYKELFFQFRTPIIVKKTKLESTNKFTVFKNSCLSEFEFYKIFSSYQAFQEVSMFIENLGNPEKPIPQPSDDVMRDIKGFDKWSFRKEPKS